MRKKVSSENADFCYKPLYFMSQQDLAKKVLHMPKLRKKMMIDFSRGLPKGYTHNHALNTVSFD